jgi:hypothetical protein
MSSIEYSCTHTEKLVCGWHPEQGADTDSRCVMAERCNIVASDLSSLIEAIGSHYALDLDDLWIPDQEEDGQINLISHSQVEDEDSNEADANDEARCVAGELDLFLCDYSFSIEKRVVAPVSIEEFKSAGIKYHE